MCSIYSSLLDRKEISHISLKFPCHLLPKKCVSRQTLGAAIVVGSSAIILRRIWRNWALKRDLRRTVQLKKQAQRDQFEELQSQCELTEEAINILNLDWSTLQSKLQTRELSAVQVLKAFIAKSLQVTRDCNAVTDFNPRAMEIAENLDRLKKIKGPLHGIPFCVKDDNNIEGMDTTLGFAKNCFKPAPETSSLVLVLEELGGIPFCKTNVPQTLLTLGSDNPIFGTTTCAINKILGPGGSSSGTGALVGGFGTFFGTGSDLGGSVRIPAHFNGVAALKPTAGRVTARGLGAVIENIVGMEIAQGIIGRDGQVVADIFKYILTNNLQRKFDPDVVPIRWDGKEFHSNRKLRIGYFTQLPFFPPIGDTIGTVERAAQALRDKGHEVVAVNFLSDCPKIVRTAANFIFADQNKHVLQFWKGEEIADCMKVNAFFLKFPKWVIHLLKFLMSQSWLPGLYSKTLTSMVGAGSETALDLWDNMGTRREMREQILAQWKNLELDAVLSPVMPFPALPTKMMGQVAVGTIYTIYWNLFEFPAGVVKFGVESGTNIDKYDTQGDICLKLAKEGCKYSVGSPIGVQVIGLPFTEELVLRVMTELEDCNDS